MPNTNRTMQVTTPGADFTLVETDHRQPLAGQVRITVQACGVCHSDGAIIGGHMPHTTFPVTTGHEIAGRIDAIGTNVTGWNIGDRVAVGWYGGSCGHCDACRHGDGVHCAQSQIPGLSYPGGFADSVVVPAVALAAIPDELTGAEAAPLACAGVTVYNALRHSAARAGDTVAILGLGGLGHLGVQFATKMGFRTIAIARGTDKAKLAYELGAQHYIDSTTENVAQTLTTLGGAQVVLATVTQGDAMSATIDGLNRRGELIVAGIATTPLTVSAMQLVHNGRTIRGHASGVAVDTQDTLRFAAQTGIRPWIEEVPLEQAGAAFGKMASGQARFRMVLTTGN